MLCHLAYSFPPFVAEFLARGFILKRNYREETITDFLMFQLQEAGDGKVLVEFPDEPFTGADMEWNFVSQRKDKFFRILLQAKRLYGGRKIRQSTEWRDFSYGQLFYRPKKHGPSQASILAATARSEGPSTFPMFVLYNDGAAIELAQLDEETHIQGVNLMSGFEVERLSRMVDRGDRAAELKKLGYLHGFFFQLADLFCPSEFLADGVQARVPTNAVGPYFFVGRDLVRPVAPSPEVICERVKNFLLNPDVQGASPPEVSAIPLDVRELLGRRSSERERYSLAGKAAPRIRVVFLSP